MSLWVTSLYESWSTGHADMTPPPIAQGTCRITHMNMSHNFWHRVNKSRSLHESRTTDHAGTTPTPIAQGTCCMTIWIWVTNSNMSHGVTNVHKSRTKGDAESTPPPITQGTCCMTHTIMSHELKHRVNESRILHELRTTGLAESTLLQIVQNTCRVTHGALIRVRCVIHVCITCQLCVCNEWHASREIAHGVFAAWHMAHSCAFDASFVYVLSVIHIWVRSQLSVCNARDVCMGWLRCVGSIKL